MRKVCTRYQIHQYSMGGNRRHWNVLARAGILNAENSLGLM